MAPGYELMMARVGWMAELIVVTAELMVMVAELVILQETYCHTHKETIIFK